MWERTGLTGLGGDWAGTDSSRLWELRSLAILDLVRVRGAEDVEDMQPLERERAAESRIR